MRFAPVSLSVFFLAALGIDCAFGQPSDAAYPYKPIRMIVPFTPASATDIIARIIGPKLVERWSKQVVIDKRPSARSVRQARQGRDRDAHEGLEGGERQGRVRIPDGRS